MDWNLKFHAQILQFLVLARDVEIFVSPFQRHLQMFVITSTAFQTLFISPFMRMMTIMTQQFLSKMLRWLKKRVLIMGWVRIELLLC